eukprot:IDg5332t1
MVPRGRGSNMKAAKFLADAHPDVHIPDSTLKNAIALMKSIEDDAQCLVERMRSMRYNNELEYLLFNIDTETGILSSVTWDFTGASCVVRRCNDLLIYDSTHNMTRYAYKLSSFSLLDSEARTRPVLFCLTLDETTSNFACVLRSWKIAFGSDIPKVVFTDGDEAMYAALHSLSDYDHRQHLICIFHLFDLNVKKKIQPILASTSGVSSWALFRKGLTMRREAPNVTILEKRWNDLLDEWLPATKGPFKVDHTWKSSEISTETTAAQKMTFSETLDSEKSSITIISERNCDTLTNFKVSGIARYMYNNGRKFCKRSKRWISPFLDDKGNDPKMTPLPVFDFSHIPVLIDNTQMIQ